LISAHYLILTLIVDILILAPTLNVRTILNLMVLVTEVVIMNRTRIEILKRPIPWKIFSPDAFGNSVARGHILETSMLGTVNILNISLSFRNSVKS